MSRPARTAALVESERAGRIEPVRLGARLAEGVAAESARFLPELLPGISRVGPLEVDLAIAPAGHAVLLESGVRNTGGEAVRLGAVVLGLRWTGAGAGALRFLRHGWQSWSVTESRDVDQAGEPGFPSGAWLRGMFFAQGEPPADRAGWHESELVTVVGASPRGPACSAGVLERGECFGVVYLRREGGALAIEIELRVDALLAPGASRRLEPVRIALGDDANALLEAHAAAHGAQAGARVRAPFQAGWCSWYHFFHDVSEEAIRRNLDALVKARTEIPIELFQLDDGYQRAIGDWLETNAKFPSGLARLAAEIHAAGFRPGLWTAPFCIASDSRIFADRREWLLRAGDELYRGLHHGMWSSDGWIHVLDASRPEVLAHLEASYAALVEMGWSYQKLDFLYTQSGRADAADPAISRAGRLRRGLEAVRRGCGEDAFLLGCGCPLGPAVGIVDGMRIGPDVAPSWHVDQPVTLPGLLGTHPSTRNGVRNVLARAWMHRRLWQNDPDCLMVRATDTKLTRDEATSLAIATAVTGGMVLFSDDVPHLEPWSRGLVRDTVEAARGVDEAGPAGTARTLDLLGADFASTVAAKLRSADARAPDVLLALVNGDDGPRVREIDLRELATPVRAASAAPVLGEAVPLDVSDGRIRASLAPHASVLVRVQGGPAWAVFCDFDGTFAVQDVGATLAKRHAAERRGPAIERMRRREIRAWQANLLILDRMPVSEAETLAFLRTVELDPGARSLISWCEARGIPFRVLSDGFDWNLDRLQEIHEVSFAYDANRLRFEDDLWRIEPVLENPACECGTGNCKRARIERFRADHPGTRIVHVGNGRVSDLCGALAADLAFAKGTLADALRERGAAFEPFETLRDVVSRLSQLA